MQLFLRAFADCDSQDAALVISDRLLFALSKFSPESARPPRPYWKMPHLFEFTFLLSPANEASFQAIVLASSGGWHHVGVGDEPSSVWNRKSDHVFLVPEVSWAEIQLIETSEKSSHWEVSQ